MQKTCTDTEIESTIRNLILSGQYPSYTRAAELGTRCEQNRFARIRESLVEKESLTVPENPTATKKRNEEKRAKKREQSRQQNQSKKGVFHDKHICKAKPDEPKKPPKTPAWAEVDLVTGKPLTWRTGLSSVSLEGIMSSIREFRKAEARCRKIKPVESLEPTHDLPFGQV